MAEDIRDELLRLIYSGEYEISQQIGEGPVEEYEGCSHSLLMAIQDSSTGVEKLDDSDPGKHETDTYRVRYNSCWGKITLLIWEV